MPLRVLLGSYLSALLLVNAVVVDLMLFLGIHILGFILDDSACVVEQVAYA